MGARQSVLELFQDGTLAGKTLMEICKILNIPYREKKRLQDVLGELIKESSIFVDDGGRYGTSEQLGLIEGEIRGNERGFAFLIPKNRELYPEDFFIPRKALFGALHGDLVLAQKTYGTGDEAKVVQILSRGYTKIVGTFRRDKRAGYLFPDEKKFNAELYIPLSECAHIKNGVKAVAEITGYPYGKNPSGKIVEILGDEDDFFAEELSIIRSYNLREEFPPHVEKEAEKQQRRGISQNDLQNRRDFRDKLIVTIDGEDTRDIDDAVSLEKTEKGYLLSVHIADVTHYVQPSSPLDEEALSRATSVYFPDRVLPMLPRALSNGICSLNEGEDRLTLSCIMEINEKGVVTGSEIVEGVIRSAHKMTYNEIMQILDGEEDTCKKYADVLDMVRLFAQLTRLLQQKRASKGSITLDVKEAKILFDKETNEISIPDYKRLFSYQIIEAFMVLANETVATYASDLQAPFVYRIHEKPNEEKASVFRAFAQTLGVNARFSANDVKPYDYQNVLKASENHPAFAVLNRVMLRSMQKARYSPENLGHFGLASECYCHFTSPIRRYPDLCIHRIIKEILHGNYERVLARFPAVVEHAAEQSSAMERKASDAERDVDDLYKTMYMSERIGEEYEAVISGVTSFGIFAELPNTVEGFIPLESLEGSYEFDAERFRLRGSRASYTIGERLLVRVDDVDFYRRRTLFRLLEKLEKEENTPPMYETNAKNGEK